AEKTPYKGRLDVTHYKSLTLGELKEIEKTSNKIVMENRKVKVMIMDRNTAEEQFGFTIYQGGAVPGRKLRIIEIENWDAEACGGTHVSNTGEIGLIKITGSERIQDGVVRLEYVTGEKAVEFIQKQEDELHKISKLLDVPVNQVYKATEKFYNLSKALKKKIEKIQKAISVNNVKPKLISEFKGVKLLYLKVESDSIKDLINIGAGLLKSLQYSILILIGERKRIFIVLMVTPDLLDKINAGEIIKEDLKSIGIKGGGKKDLGQGSGPIDLDLDKVLEVIKNRIKRELKNEE
ncbi:MAG: DHHA1 domain-containing protein, partial [Candidatus Odinarchaeia archaeon]